MLPLTAVLDRSGELGDEAGLHALIVGVSDYRHLPSADAAAAEIEKAYGMTKLTSPARSAVKMWRWLVSRQDKLSARLATCRLVVCASPAEMAAEPELRSFPQTATFDAFARAADGWRQAARRRSDDVTFLYFAGHGVQEVTTDDHVLLFEDFAAPGAILRNGARASEILAGMAPSEEQQRIARTQFYFLDTCRNTPAQFTKYAMLKVGSIWDVETTTMSDDRVCPIFSAAEPRGTAYAGIDNQTLFNKALLACFEGGAGMPLDDGDLDLGWGVSVSSLITVLQEHLDKLNIDAGANQAYSLNRYNGRSMVIHFLDSPPPVDVTLTIEPDGAVPLTKVLVLDDGDNTLRELRPPDDEHPYRQHLSAGDYFVVAQVDPPNELFVTKRRTLRARPPHSPIQVRMVR